MSRSTGRRFWSSRTIPTSGTSRCRCWSSSATAPSKRKPHPPRSISSPPAKDVDLVFSDVVLPGQTDGLALARTVTTRYPNIPVVLTTGYTKVFDTGPEFPVLRKPYQISALGRVIHDALDSPPTIGDGGMSGCTASPWPACLRASQARGNPRCSPRLGAWRESILGYAPREGWWAHQDSNLGPAD